MKFRIKIRFKILFGNDFQGKEKVLFCFLFKEQVVGKLADADESLTFRVLVDEKIDDAGVEVAHIFV